MTLFVSTFSIVGGTIMIMKKLLLLITFLVLLIPTFSYSFDNDDLNFIDSLIEDLKKENEEDIIKKIIEDGKKRAEDLKNLEKKKKQIEKEKKEQQILEKQKQKQIEKEKKEQQIREKQKQIEQKKLEVKKEKEQEQKKLEKDLLKVFLKNKEKIREKIISPGTQENLIVSFGDRVFFDKNSSNLDKDAMLLLQNQVVWLNVYSDVNVILEGHSDSNGTIDLALALGRDRALSVKKYLVSLGIDASRIKTISYGKERLAVNSDSEGAHSQNRRVVMVQTSNSKKNNTTKKKTEKEYNFLTPKEFNERKTNKKKKKSNNKKIKGSFAKASAKEKKCREIESYDKRKKCLKGVENFRKALISQQNKNHQGSTQSSGNQQSNKNNKKQNWGKPYRSGFQKFTDKHGYKYIQTW